MTLEPNIYFEHISNAHREDLEKCFNMSSQVQNRLRYNRERAWSRVWKTRKPLERALQNYILPHICSSPDYKYRPLQIICKGSHLRASEICLCVPHGDTSQWCTGGPERWKAANLHLIRSVLGDPIKLDELSAAFAYVVHTTRHKKEML